MISSALRRSAFAVALSFALTAVTPLLDADAASAQAASSTSARTQKSVKNQSKKSPSRKTTARKPTSTKQSKTTSKPISRSAAKNPTKKTASEKTALEKSRAESQKLDVERKLSALEQQLSEKAARQEEAQKALQKADQAINDANKRLRSLSQERRTVENRLAQLKRDGRRIEAELDETEKMIGQIARAQYLHARRPQWHSYIDGINPGRRMLEGALLEFLQHAQVRAADDLERKQTDIRNFAEETRSRSSELSRIAKDEEQSRRELLAEKKDRQQAATNLKRDIASTQAELDKLKKDQARLGSLVAAIDARLEKERAEEEAARRAEEKARKAQQPSRSASPSSTTFAKLKGRLAKPVHGRITARYGARRTGSALWQGIQFRAPEGADVNAVAAGTVVFADWLRGYGNLIIIDHGDNYMSVYANNDTLLKNVGEHVQQGETIGAVGSSGGDDEPGLYFEIRHRGKPINPSPWLGL